MEQTMPKRPTIHVNATRVDGVTYPRLSDFELVTDRWEKGKYRLSQWGTIYPATFWGSFRHAFMESWWAHPYRSAFTIASFASFFSGRRRRGGNLLLILVVTAVLGRIISEEFQRRLAQSPYGQFRNR